MKLYHYFPGSVPVIVNIPHTGTYVPEAILERFTSSAKQLPDTDWYLERLYAFAQEMGAHVLIATHSRYVVDLNRDVSGKSLYPGKFSTGLCPNTLFDGQPLYKSGLEIDSREISERVKTYWQPYHNKLQTIIDELKNQHQCIVVFDAHSIRSEVPTLFEGVLPDLNIGTADGASADISLTEKIFTYSKSSPYSVVCNARFKGGYITRHYGDPKNNVHAIQLELAQHNYMNESLPFVYEERKAQKLQDTLRGLLSVISTFLSKKI